jgi:hypothetical protein
MFELLTPQAATLTGVVPRNEMHGDDEVLAVTLGLKITAANLLLDRLSPTLRAALYLASRACPAWIRARPGYAPTRSAPRRSISLSRAGP